MKKAQAKKKNLRNKFETLQNFDNEKKNKYS